MIRVLLQSDDTYFVKAFSKYASTKCRSIEFLCFTTAEKAVKFLAETTLRLDAVLATESVLEQVTGSTLRLQVSDRTVFADKNAVQINIYQSGTAIISDVSNALILAGNRSITAANGHQVQVVAAVSAQGGSGKTTICYALAAAAARTGKQALYLNLEPFPAFGQLYQQNFASTMDSILFALKSGQDLAPAVLDSMERNRDNVLVLPPFSFAGDLMSLTKEQIGMLLQVLIDKTSVDMILVDLPEGFGQMNLWVLELCTAVLQVYTDDAAGRERLERVRADVYFKNLEIPGAIMTVLNKCRQRTSEEDIAGKFPMSESLAQGKQIADVQEKNPAFLKSCMDLLEKMA